MIVVTINQIKKEEKLISAGDVVFIPSNEIHWHGAAADSEFSHI